MYLINSICIENFPTNEFHVLMSQFLMFPLYLRNQQPVLNNLLHKREIVKTLAKMFYKIPINLTPNQKDHHRKRK